MASKTATIYSSTADGSIASTNASYATARNATTGTLDNTSAFIDISNELITSTYQVGRSFLFFDLTSIRGEITAATLSLAYTGLRFTNVADTVQVVSTTCNNPLQAGDFDLVGTTAFVDSPPAYTDFTTDTYLAMTLNASGIAALTTGAVSKLALRATKDISNTTPANRSLIRFHSAEQGGALRPKLDITYTPKNIGNFLLQMM